MTSGTKIMLSMITLFVVVLVAYYGFFMPEDDSGRAVIRDPIAAGQASPEPSPPANAPRERPAVERPEADEAGDTSRAAAPESTPLTDTADESSPRHDLVAARPALHAPVESVQRVPARIPPALIPLDRSAPPPIVDSGSAGIADQETGAGMGASPSALPTAAETSGDGERVSPAGRPALRGEIAAPATGRTYVVRPGDTMSSIAGQWLGDASQWPQVAKANPLVDPNRMRVGQRLRLPVRDDDEPTPSGSPAVVSGKTHVVREGDTLCSIALDHYGDDRLWRALYEANRRLIGSSPDVLKVGAKLVVPAGPTRR